MIDTLPFVHSLTHIDTCVAAIRSCTAAVPDVISGVDVRTLTPTTLGRMLAEANLAAVLHRMREQVGAGEYLAHAEALETYAYTEPVAESDQARRLATGIVALRSLHEQSIIPGPAGVRVTGIITCASIDLTRQLTELLADPQARAIAAAGNRLSLPVGY